MSNKKHETMKFSEMGLSEAILKALDKAGYESPTPIQAHTIEYMLAGDDVIGQAQTGTGKTAAFALPILSRVNLRKTRPQALILTPTRELAIQVAEAFKTYAHYMKSLHVLPIYGGQEYKVQLKQLKRGVHIVVGTPGRVMDHMRRGTLQLDSLSTLILDEADEMLRMGFLDDVKWVLEQTPPEIQIALFSATMPDQIRDVAQQHLDDPKEIHIRMKTTTAENIQQRYWVVSYKYKLDLLTRILEAQEYDGVLVFVRTKTESVSLVEKLEARGYASAALNGDIKQSKREKTVDQFKRGKLDILVATDVAARGLDVDRISLVINYDMPFDTETYVHRVGRTGRAGRSGEAILFAQPREKRMLKSIERATGQPIEMLKLPSTKDINDRRVLDFKQKITDIIETDDLEFYRNLVESYRKEHDIPSLVIAAALARIVQGEKPLLIEKQPGLEDIGKWDRRDGKKEGRRREDLKPTEAGMKRYRINVGRKDRARPNNIVGAIANEVGIPGKDIRNIDIDDFCSYLDLPADLPKEIQNKMQGLWICERKTTILPLGSTKKKAFTKKNIVGGRKKRVAKKDKSTAKKKRFYNKFSSKQ